ncbi:LacI family DNA-binding transcriptional regulator [Loigolactobacillus zhaoyuanensis]|uniref:LacI family DNA-binding transcriptional regulator n=1 Tax=Loigolactobacillus zhaoyuanensis TaxID=2486017 RepID=UPI000F73916E|nr:LacI family DNA-binding transcriptional regulator [Loigolactobacillus zhaoyuanensis]
MATIRDVARLAGVSPSTASRALRGNPVISGKTRKKVETARRQLNYVPNFSAQNLANNENNTIGVILPVDHHEIFNNPFFLQALQGINAKSTERNFMVAIATGISEQQLLDNVEFMLAHGRINRFILLYSQINDPVVTLLQENQAGYVVIGKPAMSTGALPPYIDTDNIAAGTDATNFLLARGHRHIAFLYTDLSKIVQKERLAGYQQIMAQQQLDSLSLQEDFIDYTRSNQHVTQFLQQHPAVTAFVTSDDLLGLRLQQIVHKSMSIISFNNSFTSQVAHPALTSIDVFPVKLGEGAAELALQLDQTLKAPQPIIVPHQIIVRHSVVNLTAPKNIK